MFTAPEVKTWIRHSVVRRFDLSGQAKYFFIPLDEQTKQNKINQLKKDNNNNSKQTNKEKENVHV